MSFNGEECVCRQDCLDFVCYLIVIIDMQWLMIVNGIHVAIDILVDDKKKVVNHLLNILAHLYEIIDFSEQYKCCTLALRNLDNPNIFYKF